MDLTLLEGIVLCATVIVTLHLYSQRLERSRLPPGPPGLPIIGNLHQLPPKRPHPKLREWAHQYGEIFHIRVGPRTMIVLNTPEAAEELLHNRGRKYSSRAPLHVAHELVSDGQRLVLMPYTRECKVSRKAILGAVGPGPAKRLRVYQDLESRVTMKDLLDHGDKSLSMPITRTSTGELHVPEEHWFSLIRRYTTSIVLNITYGQRVYKIENTPFLHELYDVVEVFTRVGQAGSYLADAYPILQKLPDFLAPWRAEGRRMHEREMALWGTLFDANKAAWKAGSSPECLVSSYLTARAENGHEDAPGRGLTEDGWMRDKLLTYTAATVLEAGSDTTAGALQAFVLFMVGHPHVLKKAREEIDAAVGPDRLPTFEDEPNLPYFVACVKETMRRRPISPLGAPHMADEDDVYKGYFIPKGSVVVGNIWTMHMDPIRYPNPTTFDPERFYELGKTTRLGSGNGQEPDREHYTFGWGHRFCPGWAFAEASLFLVGARIVWGFDFCAMNDPKSGLPIIPDIGDEIATWTDGFNSGPRVFHVSWKARDEKRAEVINEAFEGAQAEWRARGMHPDER